MPDNEKEDILKTARMLAEKEPIESTDLAAYLGITKQKASGYLRLNHQSIGLESEKIQPDPLLTPRYVYSVAGKTDEGYVMKKKQKISEVRKSIPSKKSTRDGAYDLNREPEKRNENNIPSRIFDMAERSNNKLKK